MTKILHVGKYYPPHRGGIESYLQQLVSRQSKLFDVQVVVANDSRRTRMEQLDGAAITRVGRYGVVASMPLTPASASVLRRFSSDLVHLHTPNPGGALGILAGHPSGKLVITHHADTLGRKYLRRLADPIVCRVMERASAIIVTSTRYLDSSDELRPFRHKCRIIPLGIDLSPFQTPSLEARRSIRQQYGERLILAIGRLVPYKGFEYLIRCMRHVDGTLVLIGTGPLHDELQACIRDCGLQQKIHLLGHVDDIVPYYSAADVFVLPSITRAEAFGVVQIEAMASGTPVVNTAIPSGVPQVSIDGQTGITVPPADEEALASALNTLLDNTELRGQYGRAARERAAAEFSAETMFRQTLDLYRAILDVPGSGPFAPEA